MSAAAAIGRQQLRLLSRSGTFVLMLAVFLGMTALSGFIGWSSHSTIIRVYDETVRTLAAAGKPAPPNPFADKPRLSLLNNMIIYVPLIGALLAIVIGNLSITSDRQAGVTRVIFSRPLQRASYFWGKVGASALAGAAIMAACLALSAAGLTLINHGPPTVPELARLTFFYAVSGLYLLLFVLIGIVAALLIRSQSLGLFAAVAVWLLITFASPQFTSGLRPVASLNPVTDPASASHSRFFRATSRVKPIAVNEQYKALSARLLTAGNDVVRTGAGKTAAQVSPITLAVLLLGGWAYLLVQRHDFSEEAARD